MKAVIMAGPAMDGTTTSVADIDEPQPGPGQVAIDVAYAGVNFIDVMARRGDPGYASGWPYVPGLEVAGTIRSVGSEPANIVPLSGPSKSRRTCRSGPQPRGRGWSGRTGRRGGSGCGLLPGRLRLSGRAG